MRASDRILLGHGAGGRLTRALVKDLFVPLFSNPALEALSDAAVLPAWPGGRPALTTDAFVVDPLEFPGGDLGRLAVCGTVNDLCVSGARPLWLTFALVLEEGAEMGLLRRCAESAAEAARDAGVQIVAGDTKVVPKGRGDKIYAVTAGLGSVPEGRDWGDHRVAEGDALLVTGPVGDHGATIMACRHGMAGEGLRSDVAPLNGLVEALAASGAQVHALHDPTRGGVLVTCHEVAERAGVRIVLDEEALPVRGEVRAVCDLLGLHPLSSPCEGRALVFVEAGDAERALKALRSHPFGTGAARVGRVEAGRKGASPVAVRTVSGEERPLDLLSGAELPRIC
ncbi:MAG: hydrogenase expression/formation protein HypE [Acidobacteriota bacterium]